MATTPTLDSQPSTSGSKDTAVNISAISPTICIKCRLQFSKDCKAKLLPCLHSACSQCLINAPQGVFKCPLCKQVSQHLQMLSENPFVNERSIPIRPSNHDTSPLQSSVMSSSQRSCTGCEDTTAIATAFCVQCRDWLCECCVSAHMKVRLTKDHTLKLKSQVEDSGDIHSGNSMPQYCPIHPAERFQLFCLKCDTVNCTMCQLTGHRDHQYVLIDEYSDTLKKQLRTLLDNVDKKECELLHLKTVLEKNMETIKFQEKKIKLEVTHMMMSHMIVMFIQCKKLFDELKSITREVEKSNESKEEALDGILEITRHCKAFASEALMTSNHLLLKAKRPLVCQLLNIVKTGDAPYTPTQVSIKTSSDAADICKVLVHTNAKGTLLKLSPYRWHGFRSAVKNWLSIATQPQLSDILNVISDFPYNVFEGRSRRPEVYSTLKELLVQCTKRQESATVHPQTVEPPRLQTPPFLATGADSSIRSRMSSPFMGYPGPMAPQHRPPFMGGRRPIADFGQAQPHLDYGHHRMQFPQPSIPKRPHDTAMDDCPLGIKSIKQEKHDWEADCNESGFIVSQRSEDWHDDWCAVCNNGGELLLCDFCPRVFHLKCHVPSLHETPAGSFRCTFCRDPLNSEMITQEVEGKLSGADLLRCEQVLLCIYGSEKSLPFHEPVPKSVPHYFKIIHSPMDMSIVKAKAARREYANVETFVQDVCLMISNCYTYNGEHSELGCCASEVQAIMTDVLLKKFPKFTEKLSISSLCAAALRPHIMDTSMKRRKSGSPSVVHYH